MASQQKDEVVRRYVHIFLPPISVVASFLIDQVINEKFALIRTEDVVAYKRKMFFLSPALGLICIDCAHEGCVLLLCYLIVHDSLFYEEKQHYCDKQNMEKKRHLAALGHMISSAIP